MNVTFKNRVQEPYNEAWNILKTIRDDNSDEAWEKFRKEIDKFHERIEAVKPRGNEDFIKGEKQFLEYMYSAILEMGEMSAWILNHEEKDKA